MKSTKARIRLIVSAFLFLSCAKNNPQFFAGRESIKIDERTEYSDGYYANAVFNACDDSLIILVSFRPYPITMKIKSGRELRHGDYVGDGDVVTSNDSMYYFHPIIYRTKEIRVKIDSLQIFKNDSEAVSFKYNNDTLSLQSEFYCSTNSCQENIYRPFIGDLDTTKSNDTLITHSYQNGIRINLKDKIKTRTYFSGATIGCKFEEVLNNDFELDRGRWRLKFYK